MAPEDKPSEKPTRPSIPTEPVRKQSTEAERRRTGKKSVQPPRPTKKDK